MSEQSQDLVIIGSGPGSLSAAIYASREDIATVVYEKAAIGGMVATIDHIDNYPGFKDGLDGYELVDQMSEQAKRFGARIEYGEVSAVRSDGKYKIVTVDGNDIKTKTVLIASGRSYGKLNVPGEAEYFGKGVHYCATCDGAFYKGKKLAVVGGANSAIQEAIYLTRFATHIDLLVRSTIKATQVLMHELDKLVNDGKVTIHLATSVEEVVGQDGHVDSLLINKNDTKSKLVVDGVFIFVGLHPNTDFLKNGPIVLDEKGFVLADAKLSTNLPGVFVCGDVRQGATMQIIAAAGDGATAAINIRDYLSEFNSNK